MRSFVHIQKGLLLVSCFFFFCARGQSPNDVLSLPATLTIKGIIGERLDGSYQNRILAQDVDRLVDVFKPENRKETRMWQSEFWGKWFTSAVLAYRYKPSDSLAQVLAHAVHGLLVNQTSDGYIGNYDASHRLEQWDVWGRKYCMLGLLAYYDLKNDKKVLKAAARLADNLMDDLAKTDGILVTKGNYRGMAASSVLEPICLLYERTGQKKYLDFAETIVRQWENPQGPQLIGKSKIDVAKRFSKPKEWYSWEQGHKAYEMMSCYEGLLELYRLTGKETYKNAVIATWQNIYDTEINIAGSGASTEMWFGGRPLQAFPVHHYQETCVTVTWIKLSAQLLRLTGERKYADAMEYAFYNALLGAMSKNGAQWAKYTPLTGQRLPGSEQCGMGLNCCEASGPRALFLFPAYAAMQRKDGVQLNFYLAGSYQLESPKKQKLNLIQSTDYPRRNEITIQIDVEQSEQFSVRLRIPTWSKETKVWVNDRLSTAVDEDGFLTMSRSWKKGDKIRLNLDMRGRMERIDGLPTYLALMRGPIVLSRDDRFGGPPLGSILQPILDRDGYVPLDTTAGEKSFSWMQYAVRFIPESYTEQAADPITVVLCDYASAGNEDIQHPFFQTWFPQLLDGRKE